MLIVLSLLFVACASKKTSSTDDNNAIIVGKDYHPKNGVTFVFKYLHALEDAVKAINADDEQGFEKIVFNNDISIIITDTIHLRIYAVENGYSEVSIRNGIHQNEKGYVINNTIKPIE